jgi:hypothetical protein
MMLMDQLKKNTLAIISLTVAISALSYNTYRNELTEVNRNVRHAGFELLKELNQLQLLSDYAHYDKDVQQGNPITGWGHVMYIQDMSHLISVNIVEDANRLSEIWSQEWESVNESGESNQRITNGINELRSHVRYEISSLK